MTWKRSHNKFKPQSDEVVDFSMPALEDVFELSSLIIAV